MAFGGTGLATGPGAAKGCANLPNGTVAALHDDLGLFCIPLGLLRKQTWQVVPPRGKSPRVVTATFAGGDDGRQFRVRLTCDPKATGEPKPDLVASTMLHNGPGLQVTRVTHYPLPITWGRAVQANLSAGDSPAFISLSARMHHGGAPCVQASKRNRSGRYLPIGGMAA